MRLELPAPEQDRVDRIPPSRHGKRPNYALRRTVAGAFCVAVIAAGLAVATGGTQHRDSRATAAAAASPPSSVAGRYAVGLRSLRILEPAAPGIADATAGTGQPARLLPTEIRYPAVGRPLAREQPNAPAALGAGPFPLIVFSQGYDTRVAAYARLLDTWARAGYVVAAPTYPHTDPTAAGGLDEGDIVNHPADLRFVISTLVAQAQSSDGPLAHLLNRQQIALAGQSDGGDVSLAVAANSCCKDSAVKAAAILSAAELPGFGGTYYGSGSPPLLVIQGDRDTINAPGCSAALYDQAAAPKYYVDLLGAKHLPPYLDSGPAQSYVATAVIDFLDYYLKNKEAGLLRLRQAGGLPGVATLTSAAELSGESAYCPP